VIICRACGHHNDSGDAFCASCGAFLEWEGETEDSQAAEDEVVVGADDADGAPAGPQPVLPARARQQVAPRQSTEYERVIRPGDLICGRCGDGNAPDRNFCRRCGNSLAEAETAERRRWWHRFTRRRRRTYAAGERRGRRGRMREAATKGRTARVKARMSVGKVLRAAGMVMILAGAAGIAFIPSLRDRVDGWVSDQASDVQEWGSQDFQPVRPVGADATSSVRGHPPIDAVNLTDNRWWAAKGGDDDGIGEKLTVDFGKRVDIDMIGVLPGAADPKVYAAQPRPRQLRLVFDNGATTTVDVEDVHEFQTFEVDGADGTKKVVVEVTAVYRGQDGSELSLTSLEFQTGV
jgi:hypothetical protein